MIPGKTYKPEDYLEILWRRKWVGIIPFVVAAVGTFVGSQLLPNQFRSEARVMIIPQQVPENYVQTTVTATVEDRLASMGATIQSRTRLEQLIQRFDLYKEERERMIMEDVVTLMRANIGYSPERPRNRRDDPGFFTVSFLSPDPRAAMQVTEALATAFINENVTGRTTQAEQTNQFLQAQLDEARRNLVDHEQKLEAFRRTYSGQLPTQVQSNLSVMQGTQVQLQAIRDTINRDTDRQLVLQRMLADAVALDEATSQATMAANPTAVSASAPAAEQLTAARTALAALQLRLKPEHPDVRRMERTIAELEAKAEQEALRAPLSAQDGSTTVRPLNSTSVNQQQRLSGMRAELESLERRIATSRVEEVRLNEMLEQYRARIEVAPTREAEMTDLMRDYQTLQENYQSLLNRSQESRIAADLERRQIGEQFRVVDPARLPIRPFSPDRLRINLMGSFAGLALGIALIGLLEYRDTSLRTDDDVVMSLALPVLAVIPIMISAAEKRRIRRRRFVMVGASLVVTIGIVAVVVWRMNLLDRIPGF
ncbi:MAG: GNVR domain-containing protein [Vicinamibacterales bacterium]